jgi:hypothetical protein
VGLRTPESVLGTVQTTAVVPLLTMGVLLGACPAALTPVTILCVGIGIGCGYGFIAAFLDLLEWRRHP